MCVCVFVHFNCGGKTHSETVLHLTGVPQEQEKTGAEENQS